MIDGILPPRRPVSRGDSPNPNPSQTPDMAPPQPAPSQPNFKSPELVAAEDGFVQKLDMPDKGNPKDSPKPKKRNRVADIWSRLGKKQRIAIIAVTAAILLGGGGVSAYLLTRPDKTPPPVTVKTEEPAPEPPKPTTVASPLTGVQVAPALAELPVTGVMIENSPDARPQSGLNQAGVVFEAIAEGGITRFLALFQESQPEYVGPVRSVRPYYLEWLQGYDAAVAHVGGSPEAINMIKTQGIRDLDQFYNTGPYQRVNTRYAPHNMYTSLPKLVELGKSKGFTRSNFTGFARKQDAPAATPNARTIDVTISSYLYNPHYDYDPTTNTYKRVLAGKPHTDERSKEQLSPKVVVVMVVPYSIHADRIHSVYQTTGSGKAFIFQDGSVTEGIWEKSGSKSGIRFGDATGAPLAINAGQTWISAVGVAGSVAYKP